MVELSLPKLLVVMIIALVVIGPEKLPKLANFLGRSIGKMRKIMSTISTELAEDASPPNDIKKIEQDSSKHV